MLKCKYFEIHELVSEQVFLKYGETAWLFFDHRLLKTIDAVREGIGKPITANNWYWMDKNEVDADLIFDERGLRCNMDPLVKNKTDNNIIYCSPHVFGMAIDCDIKGMTAQQARDWIEEHQDILPYNIRLEKDVNWVHLDVEDKGVKIYYFKK